MWDIYKAISPWCLSFSMDLTWSSKHFTFHSFFFFLTTFVWGEQIVSLWTGDYGAEVNGN